MRKKGARQPGGINSAESEPSAKTANSPSNNPPYQEKVDRIGFVSVVKDLRHYLGV